LAQIVAMAHYGMRAGPLLYAWDGEGERALMSVLFQNDALVQKTQFGLK
jgi:hypothetical protein